ncbi:TPA: hypothetical protein H2W70_004118 [Salmonella enterica]|nr:hypothetical protein [Salmonella enterica]HAK8195219.1 hypothetical protein [Salmonella enterica]HAK8434567.1 hypothetical protein [Salmonella enterica]HAK8462315.1 hypothetical protein [Salmonella enterica]
MGTGNTTGKIVGQPPVPEKTAEEANPVVSAETKEEKGFFASLFDLNTEFRGRWLAVSALHHGQYESFRATAESFGDKALAGFDGVYNSADVQFASVMVSTMGVGRSGGAPGAGSKSSAAGGRFRGTGFGMQTPALAGAGGMPYGQGIQILNAERRAAESAVKKVEKTTGSAVKKAEKEVVKDKPNVGGKSKVKKKQKPHKKCGNKEKYTNNYKEKKVMNADHAPSGAALKKAAENKLKEMGIWNKLSAEERKSILNKVYNDAPTISIPEDIHKKGRTYGGKNKSTQSSMDAKDLNGAFKKDTDLIQELMDASEKGCSEAYKKSVDELSKMDWNKYINDTVTSHKNVAQFIRSSKI